MVTEIRSVPELFDRLGGPAAVARLIGKPASTASEMKRRRSIPVEYWPVIINAGAAQDIGLDAEKMLRLHAAREAAE